MEQLTLYIIDDQLDTQLTVSSFAGALPGIILLGHETNPEKACQKLLSGEIKPDVVILDIDMPQMQGDDLAEVLLAELQCHIIFITGHERYPRKVFELNAVDYLMKPITLPRFSLAMTKARRLRSINKPSIPYLDYLFIPGNGNGNHFPLPVQDIRYIKADSSYSHIYTIQEKNNDHYTHYAIKELEQALDTSKFLRISRSYIVSIAKVRNVTTKHIELDNGYELSIGDNYKDIVKKRLMLRSNQK